MQVLLLRLLVLSFCCIALIWANDVKRVAIIGSGAGGSSSAYFLKETFGNEVRATIFERASEAGGRMKTVHIHDLTVEIGAGVYHKQNYYVRNLSLSVSKSDEKRMLDTGEQFGIWNGKEFPWQSRSYRLWTLAEVLYRYGLSPFSTDSLAHKTLLEFLTLYDKLDHGYVFEDVETFVKETFSEPVLNVTLRQYLLNHDISNVHIDEIVTALTRINYNQDSNLSALAGLVALVGSGDDVTAPTIGMQNVSREVIKHSKADLRLSTNVKSIEYYSDQGKSGYRVRFAGSDGTAELEFDAVIIAAPLEFLDVEFKGFSIPKEASKKTPYRSTYVTLVAGERNKNYFGVGEDGELPGMIGTIEDEGIPFSSMTLKEANNKTHVYKIFSRTPVSEELLNKLFKKTTSVYRHEWTGAYPMHTVNPTFVPFKLHNFVYYPSSLEKAVSCMEISMVSAKNTVNMLAKDWKSVSQNASTNIRSAPDPKREL